MQKGGAKRFAPLAFFYKSFVRSTTSVSPLDRDKDIVLDPRKMLAHFSALYFFAEESMFLVTVFSMWEYCRNKNQKNSRKQ